MSENKQALRSKLEKARRDLAEAQLRVAELEALLPREHLNSNAPPESESLDQHTLDNLLGEIQMLVRLPNENPSPVLRVAGDGTLLYANPASHCLLALWGCEVGTRLPEDLRQVVAGTFAADARREVEVVCNGAIYALLFVALADAGYAYVYGRDVTYSKQVVDELEALYNATSYLFKADNLQNLGQQIVETVVREFDQVDCGLMLVDREQDRISRFARTGEYNIKPDIQLTLDGLGLVPMAVRTGSIVYVRDVTLDSSYLPSEARTRSELVIPLKTSRGVIAVLDLQRAEVDGFSERDQRILSAYAERAAAALESMQLYEAINQHAAELEQRVVERTAELQAAKEQGEAILNNSLDGLLLVDTKFRIQQANPAGNSQFVTERDDIIGRSLLDFICADDAGQVALTLQTAFIDQSGKHIEARCCRKDGATFDAEISVGYINDAGLVCAIRDITARKQSEQALKAKLQEEREFQIYLKGLHEIAIELMQIDELDTFYRRAVELGRQRLGFERLGLFLYDEATGVADGTYGTDLQGNLADERHVHFTPQPTDVMLRALEGIERFAFNDSVQLSTALEPAGTGWNAAAVLWNGTESLGWLAADNAIHQLPASKSLLDILSLYALALGTLLAQKRAQVALRESEARFRRLVEAAPIAVVITSHAGRIVLVNEQAERLFGYQRDELVGQQVELLVPDRYRDRHTRHRMDYVAAPRLRRMGSGMELFARRKDGSEFPVEIELGYIETDDGIMVMSFVLDITERKSAEAALRWALAREQELSELKSRFVSMASHEFRTPLATILATTETLSAYRHKLTEDQIDLRFDKIKEQIGQLKSIMDDVLQLARMQARRVEFNLVNFDLDALCQSVLDEHQDRSDATHQLQYACDDALHEVRLDKKLMRQIIGNLVSNAIKYSPRGTTITVSLEHVDAALVLRVGDEGIGIPEADMAHLFEPFHRAANVGTIPGTGLGLTIVKESVDLHGGTISVESEVGVGTVFTVRIPLATGGKNDHDEHSGD